MEAQARAGLGGVGALGRWGEVFEAEVSPEAGRANCHSREASFQGRPADLQWLGMWSGPAVSQRVHVSVCACLCAGIYVWACVQVHARVCGCAVHTCRCVHVVGAAGRSTPRRGPAPQPGRSREGQKQVPALGLPHRGLTSLCCPARHPAAVTQRHPELEGEPAPCWAHCSGPSHCLLCDE